MDKIVLHGVEFYAFGGVTSAEKTVGQRYRAHVELRRDLSVPSRTDSLGDTVSYAAVHALIVQTARERPFSLLEWLAGRIADRLLESFQVDSVTVEVQKLLPPIDGVVEYAAVQMTRGRG